MIKNLHRPSGKVPVIFFSDVNETWTFSKDFRKVLKHQVPWKSIQWEQSYWMRAGGRTHMTKQTVAFRYISSHVKISHHLQDIVHRTWLPNTILITSMQICFEQSQFDIRDSDLLTYVFPEHANCHEMSPAGAGRWCSTVLCSEIVSPDALLRACFMLFRGFMCWDFYGRYP
jgi:hypothetical protein